ncbi:MAG: hypothetical protein AB4426_21430 [Xenococcaceae cyanobacterium]
MPLVQRGLNSVPIKHWSLDAYRYPKRRSLLQEAEKWGRLFLNLDASIELINW